MRGCVNVEIENTSSVDHYLMEKLNREKWNLVAISGNRIYIEKDVLLNDYRLKLKAFVDANKQVFHIHSFYIEPLKLIDVDDIMEILCSKEWSFSKEGRGVLFWRNNPYEREYKELKSLEEEVIKAVRLGLKLDILKLLGLRDLIDRLVKMEWLIFHRNLEIEGRKCIIGKKGTALIEFKALIIGGEAEISIKTRIYITGLVTDLIPKLRSMGLNVSESRGVIEAESTSRVGLSTLSMFLKDLEERLLNTMD